MRGRRVRLSEAFYDGQSLTLLAACNVQGFVSDACRVIGETVDSAGFVSWVKHYLCPCLGDYAKQEPNSIVILDNVNQHWSQEAIDLITKPVSEGGRGSRLLFLPPYSPEFNPIELGFSWLKSYIRRHFLSLGGNNRAVLKAMYDGVRELPPRVMSGYFRKCGYQVESSYNEDDEVAIAAISATAALAMMRRS